MVGGSLAVERGQILPDRAARPLLVRPVDLGALDPLETAGVGLDHAGIDREAFAADQARGHARRNHLFEDLAQDIAVAEPAVPVDREGRVVGDLVLQTQPAEPAVGQVQLHLLAQPPLRADRIAVADQQHPDHQLGIDRRTARVAVVGRHLAAQPAQVQAASIRRSR